MSERSQRAALPFLAWSRLLSPVTPAEMRSEAWCTLDLPGPFEDMAAAFWTTFHAGFPSPRISLLLHAALGLEGSSVREDWLRVIHHLGLTWRESSLPPDQLGVACELYACAIERDEVVLIEELRKRYLLPWCAFAKSNLDDATPALASLPEGLEADLRALGVV